MSATLQIDAPTQHPRLDVAEIFRRYGETYRRTHRLSPGRHKAMRDIQRCRTAALGGHREGCDDCGFERYTYHSCRNRHCPKCQTTAKEAWVEARQAELLPVPYFHHVFTLPHALNPLILTSEQNQRLLLKLLFDATAQTLLAFGRRELGGKVGFTLLLHTWDQQLRAHFHVHSLMASGGLAEDGSRWIAGGARFLFPVCALSTVFRAKYLDGLAELLEENRLDIPPQLAELAPAESRHALLGCWREKPWVVYSKPPFAGPRKLLDYLGRYTHRVAISNDRILSCRDGQVRFTYRDRTDGDRRKIAGLPAHEFIRRFLQHVVPHRFPRIRHYGFLANCIKRTSLSRCRELLAVRTHTPKRNRRPSPSGCRHASESISHAVLAATMCSIASRFDRYPYPLIPSYPTAGSKGGIRRETQATCNCSHDMHHSSLGLRDRCVLATPTFRPGCLPSDSLA